MEDPLITASLGPMGRLLRRLHSFEASDHPLPEGLSSNGIRLLREGLEGLYDFLKDVPEADLDPGVTPKWWVKEVRELAYDTEDFFDDVMQSGVGAGDGVAVGRSSLVTGIISKRKQRLPQIAQDFSHLMARLDDARERCQSFHLPPETVIKSDNGQAGISRHTPEPSLDLPGSAVSISDVHKGAGRSLAGVQEPMKKLCNLLAFGDDNQKQLKVMPIFGSAGVGKTTVARTVYHQYGGEFQCRAFVRVSRYPDMRRLLTRILSQIKAPETHAFSDAQDLIDSIIKHLQGKRYFIVVDDLWTSSVWDIISRAFPYDDCCSRILTTTQVEDVALACSGYETDYIFKMGPFNDSESRKLFFRYVFGSQGEGACPKEFKVVADRIISKCNGLPLSIVNIAGLLLPRMRGPAVEQWEKVESSLPSTLRTDPTSQGMKDVLILIYNELPLHLKACLLYLSMYPEGYAIRKDDVVKQWVAESLVSDTEYGYFNELVRRGMIEPVDIDYDGEVLSCTVNHMVLDLIRHKSIEDNFIIAVNYLESTLRLPDKVRRLSVQFGGAKSAKIPESIRMSQVRSLLFCGPSRCVPSISDYGLLRVLILHIWADQDQISFDFTRVAELFRLRYLMVECNSTVNLPDKIQGLQYLETLQLDGRLSAVPSDIGHLENLRHLRLPSQANVRDLGGLTNLQDLHLTLSTAQAVDHLKDTMKYLGSILDKLSNLKSIILASAGSSPVNTSSVSISCDGLSNASPALVHLERLELLPRICIFPTLPKWFKTLGKLCSLKVAVRELSNSDTDIIRGLPALTALSLYIQTAPAERVVFGKAGFSALKYFKLRCSDPLLKFEADAMPNLQKLRLVFSAQEVQQHAAAPICIEHLAGLKEISAKIGGAGAAGTESALRISVSNDPKNPKINGQMVNWNFYSDEDKITGGSEQAAVIVEERGEILEEKTQYRMGDGNRGPYRRQISAGFTGTGSITRVVKIRFVGVGRPKDPLYTGYPVQWKNGENIKVAIFENEKQILDGDLSKLQIEILPVHADFFTDRGQGDFTKEEFNKQIYMYKGKESVLTTVNLTNGEAYLGPFSFTESSDMKRLRLAARVGRQDLAVRVQEAITDPFVVKDRRSEWLCKMGCWRIFGEIRLIKQDRATKGVLLATKRGCAPPTQAISHSFPSDDEMEYGKSHELQVLSLECIQAATCNFSEHNKLGQGGFGRVYMGTLPGGEEVAVKRLALYSSQGYQEFKNEALLLSRLQHRNLVRLLAFCIQGEEKILVYEYMPNMSLDTFIFNPEKRGLLDWRTRLDIIAGIARGLLYLHQDSRIRIIHLDLKASNILLDTDMNPKISGFGVARMFGQDGNRFTNRVIGTMGYMAPEYAMEGIFSVKSDVYSFGVLILEIITGERASSFHRQQDDPNITTYAWQQWNEGKGEELIDRSIRPLCSIRQVLRCINVALLCVQDHAHERPDIFEVILMLSSDMVSLPMPRPSTLMLRGLSSKLSENEDSDTSLSPR